MKSENTRVTHHSKPRIHWDARIAPRWLALLAILVIVFQAPNAARGGDPLGTDVALPCGEQPLQPFGSCLTTGPTPGEPIPLEEQDEGVDVTYGPGDPPPYRPGVFDVLTRTETLLPIPPGYIDYDPGFEAYVPGSRGCAPDPCALAAGIEAVIGADTREQITGTTGYPWRCIGLIRVKWDNGKWYQGTGAMIGPQHMLTCGHNLHDKDEAGATDKWAVEFEFYPGQTSTTRPKAGGGVEANPNARPYGKVGWKTVYWWKAWLDSKDRDYDMMMVVLDKPIGNTVGWFGRQTGGTDVNQWRQLSGYPGDKAQYEQWWAGGTVSSETTHQIRYDNDTIAGHSGSPVWFYHAGDDQRYIRGVHIGDRTATAANPNRAVSMNRGKFTTLSSWVADPVLKIGTACEDCGPDCNQNSVGDSLDIAHGTSQDVNGDDVPDECQPDVVLPPDQIACVGPSPGSVPVGATATITVHVSRASVALAGRWISFRSPTGNVRFLDGLLGPGATTSLASSDGSGIVTMRFQPTAPGPGTIRAEASTPDGTPYSECTFDGTPVPVLVEDLRATSDGDGVQLAWRLGAGLRNELRAIDVERSADGASGPYVQRATLMPQAEMQFDDADAARGRTYHYRLILEWTGGSASVAGPIRVEVTDALRLRTSLQAPVDRGEMIEIHYTLGGTTAPVSLDLFDVAGRHLRTLERGAQAPGSYVRLWDRRDDAGSRLARGVYIVRLQDGTSRTLTRKMALVRN